MALVSVADGKSVVERLWEVSGVGEATVAGEVYSRSSIGGVGVLDGLQDVSCADQPRASGTEDGVFYPHGQPGNRGTGKRWSDPSFQYHLFL